MKTLKFIKLVALNARFTHSCPALFYVRNELERNLPGVPVEICQFTINDPYHETFLRVVRHNPPVIMFSVSIWNASFSFRLINDIARAFPETMIVIGGPEATFAETSGLPEQCAVVRGEVEGLDHNFYQDLARGFLKREYHGGQAVFSGPYRESDFDGELRHRQVYYESSRVCPFSCSYCLSSVEAGVRFKTMEQVREELAMILSHRPKTVRFIDRTFNVDPGRALDIWRFLVSQGGDTAFHFEIAPGLFTEEMKTFLKGLPPGKFQFEIGVQSTTPEVLAAVNRKMDREPAFKNVTALIAMNNIHIHVDLILGLPFETRETFRKSFNEVYRLLPHYIQMGLLKVLPGTAIALKAMEYGLVWSSRPPYAVFVSRWMDAEVMADLYWFGECVESFHNSRFFRTVLSYIGRTRDDAFEFFTRLCGVCIKNGFFELAKTRDLMTDMLLETMQGFPDYSLALELLRFDCLRSGPRPACEAVLSAERMKETRNDLWKRMPQHLPPYYEHRTRDEFFKRGVFAWFSGDALRETGLIEKDRPQGGGHVCFLREEEGGVISARKAVLLPD